MFIASNNIVGREVYSAIGVDGGGGGNGGNGTGLGFGGNGGNGGTTGMITIINPLTGAGYNFVGPSSTAQSPESAGGVATNGPVVANGGLGGFAMKFSVAL